MGCLPSGRLIPLSFQGLRSALKLLVDSIEIKEDLDTLLDPLKNEFPAECELFLRRSKKEEIEVMLPGFRSRSKMVFRSRATSSPNEGLVGESVETDAGACWRSLESKYGSESSNVSRLGAWDRTLDNDGLDRRRGKLTLKEIDGIPETTRVVASEREE